MKTMTKKAIAIGGTTLMLSSYMATPTTITALDGVDIIIRVGEYQDKPRQKIGQCTFRL